MAREMQKTVTVAGNEYTIQKQSYRWYMETGEKHMLHNGRPSQIRLWDEYLEHVVVDPKVTVEDFYEKEELGGFKALQKLMSECETFLTE